MCKRRGHDKHRAREQSQHEACPRSRQDLALGFETADQEIRCQDPRGASD